MSQDTDAMQVVWSDSPSTSQQPGVGRGPAGPASGACAVTHPEQLQHLKNRLLSVAQRVPNPGRPATAGHGQQMQADQLLEGLLGKGRAGRAAAVHVPAAAVAGASRGSPVGPGAEPAAALTAGAESGSASQLHRTPGTGLGGILAGRARLGCGSVGAGGGKHTPATGITRGPDSSDRTTGSRQQRLPGSTRHAGGAWGGSSTGRRRYAGQKRKVLLDLLEQVENYVQGGSGEQGLGPTEEGEEEEEPGMRVAGSAMDRQEEGQEEQLLPQQPEGEAFIVGGHTANKENASQQANSPRVRPFKPGSSEEGDDVASGPAASQPAAPPVSSQQLMPPPGVPRQPAPLPGTAQQHAGAGGVAHGDAWEAAGPGQPLPAGAPSAAGLAAAAQAAAAPAGPVQEADTDDDVMAALQFELLSQIEQCKAGGGSQGARHLAQRQPAARPVARPTAAAAALAALCGAAQRAAATQPPVRQEPLPLPPESGWACGAPPSTQPAVGQPAGQLTGALGAPPQRSRPPQVRDRLAEAALAAAAQAAAAPAVAPADMRAPPPTQPVQQEDDGWVGTMRAHAGAAAPAGAVEAAQPAAVLAAAHPPKQPLASPYGHSPRPSPSPAPNPPTGAAGAAPGDAGAEGSGAAALAASDSWDDDGLDTALLDEVEAAALRDRADRSLKGEPSSSGGAAVPPAGQQQGEVPRAQEEQHQQQPGGRPLYPGDREEVGACLADWLAA